jgi:ABC-type nitrate/sulfonate/bicarbonate transport system substrate-binding protein
MRKGAKRREATVIMKKIRGSYVAVVLVIILLAVAGFFRLRKEAAILPSGPLTKITLAEARQPVVALVYVAAARGYFADQGLDVTLQPYSSGKACLNAVLGGNADFGTVAETPLVHSALRGEMTYIVATISHTERNTVIVARKDAAITGPTELKGKRIGASFGTNGEFFMDAFLTMNRLTRRDITAVNISPKDMFNALVNGEVDAVATWNPHALRLRKELGTNGITFYGEGVYRETYNVATTQAFAKSNP